MLRGGREGRMGRRECWSFGSRTPSAEGPVRATTEPRKATSSMTEDRRAMWRKRGRTNVTVADEYDNAKTRRGLTKTSLVKFVALAGLSFVAVNVMSNMVTTTMPFVVVDDNAGASPEEGGDDGRGTRDGIRESLTPKDAVKVKHPTPPDPFDTQYVKNTCVPCDDPSLSRYGPYAYIIGVEKGGTSALQTYMEDHPDIVPWMEETYVLQSTYNHRYGYDTLWQDGAVIEQCGLFQLYQEWYQEDGSIDHVERGLKYIDKTPYYIFDGPHIAQRLLCADPHAKMIVLLRNPVDRAYSEYNVSARDATMLHATLSCHAAMHGMQCARKVC